MAHGALKPRFGVRSFDGRRRVIRWTGAALTLSAVAAFVLRMVHSTGTGHGLDPYRTHWGVETAPIVALVTLGVTGLVWLCATAAAAWMRRGGTSNPPRVSKGHWPRSRRG